MHIHVVGIGPCIWLGHGLSMVALMFLGGQMEASLVQDSGPCVILLQCG